MSSRYCGRPPRDVLTSMIRLALLASYPHTLVPLDGDGHHNLESWDTTIRHFLRMENLHVFLDTDIPEPDRNNRRLWETWSTGRAVAKYALCETLSKPHIRERLRRHGWDSENKNPKYHYDLVWSLWGHLIPA
ncbi:hypothetical protein B0H65DRAFT_516311 [Neurospora tetraspora]|uniref:Uncharacterized protein n=1 Tax=Neurospora tetraspora TaxID=94610 RepID=A0AAE0JQ64_9PEZI|nr:hypothetical protein B0H65DRAFT_516311 [Neurospora tetraspora]